MVSKIISTSVAALCLSLGIADVAASQDVSAETCLALNDDQERLGCYDRQFGYVARAEEETAPEVAKPISTSSNWHFFENADDFSDQDTSYIILSSVAGRGRYNDAPDAIWIRCDGQGAFEVFVTVDGYIGGNRNDRVPVRFRFGSDDPVSELWNISTNGQGAFLPQSYNDFKTGIFSGEDFVFEVTDYQGSKSSAEFRNSDHPKLDFIRNGCR
ncbi:hypothetical protein [Marivivens aquimaris]|uniref:hypothetical protein n=1 Tax=Marivivens aquimaris TaxID=2774876 RepID=UPI00187FD668|nr:hypothetical protein [Marivivens aquimaris]